MPAPSEAPPGAIETPATPPPPAPEPAFSAWEDRVALPAAGLIVLAAALPWYASQAWFDPTREAYISGGLGALAIGLMVALRGPANETVRRQLSLLLGAGVLLDAGFVAITYASYHAATEPTSGVSAHVLYLGSGLLLSLAAAVALTWSGIRTRRPDPVAPARVAPVEAHLSRKMRWAVPLVVFLAAFAVYNQNVEKPSIIDFDEAHYVRVALNMTDGVFIDPAWGEPRPFNFEHPPVGKYFISLGYKLMGEPHDELGWPAYHEVCKTDTPECERDAYGWRVGSVFVGSLGVLGMYWLGLRLFRNQIAGVAAALLLLSDNLYYLHSRLAMLDIFPAAFALLGLGVFLGPSRAHRYFGSIFLGLGIASKHYALFVLPVFMLLAFFTGPHTSRWMRFRELVLFGLLVPFLAYVGAYLPYLFIWARMAHPIDAFGAFLVDPAGKAGALWDAITHPFRQFVFIHKEGFRWAYKAGIEDADYKPHPYVSEPWTWIPMRRPVFYFVGYDAQSNVGHIYAIGNPFVWWIGSFGVLFAFFASTIGWATRSPRLGLRAFWSWLARPFQLHRDAAFLFAALLFLSAYLPFFLLRRDPFNFYFVVAAPFFSLVLAGFVGQMWYRGRPQQLACLVFLLGAIATFVFYHPISAGTYVTEADFQYVMRALRCPEPDYVDRAIDWQICMRQ